MNKKPVLWRSIFALVVIAVFALSIYPLTPRDFYDTLEGMLSFKADAATKKEQVKKAIALAKQKQAADKGLYPSIAIEQALNEEGLDLTEFIKGQGISDNRDVIGAVRKNAGGSIRLGLDLNGGAEFILELIPDEKADASAEATKDKKPKSLNQDFERYRDIAIEILRKRLESQNIFETEISPSGSKYISLRAPIVSKDEKVKLMNLIKMSAKLQFRLVHKDNDRLVSEYETNPEKSVAPPGYQRMELLDIQKGKRPVKKIYFVQLRPEMDGKNIVEAFQTTDQYGQRQINLEFNTKGAKRFGEVTSQNVGRMLAIVLDSKLYSAPVIQTAIEGGNAVITGQFSREEADNIANALVSGSLPVRIEIEAVFDTDPTLGAQSVENSIYAGIIATLAVMVFMLIYYQRAGIIANIALVINIILLLGALAAFEATLTLPGIAGIILTIGMAVDGNVLIYERIREELEKNKSLLNAVEYGYHRAFTTIVDSNLTTLIIAVILMWVGTGAIKGFGVTLAIGIVTTMFTSLFITHLLFDLMGRFTKFATLRMFKFFSVPSFNFMALRYPAYIFSGLLILVCIGDAAYRGKDILGVDFTGGTQIILDYKERVSEAEIQKTLQDAGLNAKVSYKTSSSIKDNRKLEIFFRDKDLKTAGNLTDPKAMVSKILNTKFPKADYGGGQEITVGGLIGWEFTKSAIWALVLAFGGITIYMSIRFEFTYALGGIIALFHDSIVSVGILLLCGGEISMSVIAAVLTIIGFSINDTIVIYDRVRENLQLIKNKSYMEIINLSVNQTLSRTLLTSFTVLVVLIVLFFMGGIALSDFTFVMLIGVVTGTYSTVFIASPIVLLWHKERKTEKSPEQPSAAAEEKQITS
ncbi:MAG: hypothetical protein A2017_05890 [Lentisphaerae bacterium GWF2_44_16]|nr:MAG: hypothetical protein A2017_05890 [Lentisphaerae bacterium GWF2_44_16]